MKQFKERCKRQMQKHQRAGEYVGSQACLERFWSQHKNEQKAFSVWLRFLQWRESFSWEGRSQKYVFLGKTQSKKSVVLIRAKKIDVSNIDVKKQIAEVISVIQPLLLQRSPLLFIYDREGLDSLLPSLPLIQAVKEASKKLIEFYQSAIQMVILLNPSLAMRIGLKAVRPYLGKAGERVVLGGNLQKVLKELRLQEREKL